MNKSIKYLTSILFCKDNKKRRKVFDRTEFF